MDSFFTESSEDDFLSYKLKFLQEKKYYKHQDVIEKEFPMACFIDKKRILLNEPPIYVQTIENKIHTHFYKKNVRKRGGNVDPQVYLSNWLKTRKEIEVAGLLMDNPGYQEKLRSIKTLNDKHGYRPTYYQLKVLLGINDVNSWKMLLMLNFLDTGKWVKLCEQDYRILKIIYLSGCYMFLANTGEHLNIPQSLILIKILVISVFIGTPQKLVDLFKIIPLSASNNKLEQITWLLNKHF